MIEINKSDFMGGLRPGMPDIGASDQERECRVDRENVCGHSHIRGAFEGWY